MKDPKVLKLGTGNVLGISSGVKLRGVPRDLRSPTSDLRSSTSDMRSLTSSLRSTTLFGRF